ncbi:uncharacterized protein LOC143017794 [Oratosquilla oratoria]|uniref:uncharacterized protein LOC143017794 n=1 Tax=Oratosquilla oratoria TaxID=337810 RepID=UPI003F76B638
MNMSGYSALSTYSESMVRWQGAGYSLGATAAAAIQSLPPELDIASSISVTPFKPLHLLSGVSDIILLAEFSEIEGPMPLVTIPAKKHHGIDLNDFVVKVMSTDYQNTSGEFRVCSDTQLVQQNIEAGIHAYVHYFTLYDVRARGFVRPMCLAYISRDAQKLLTYFSMFRNKFCSITNYLKWSNLSWFSSELHHLITDLEYTKDRYIEHMRDVPPDLTLSTVLGRPKRYSFHGQTTNGEFGSLGLRTHSQPSSSPSPTLQFSPTTALSLSSQLGQFLKFNRSRSEGSESRDEEEYQKKEEEDRLRKEEEESMLKHTTLEAVAGQLLDCQHIIHTILPYMDQPGVHEEISNLKCKVHETPDSPLHQCLEELHLLTDEADSVHKPSIFVMSLMKRNFKDMRGIMVLCGVSYVLALIKLLELYERFSKPYLTLQFEDLDQKVYNSANGSLFIGTIPVINIDSSSQSKNDICEGTSHGFTNSLWDSELIQLLMPNRGDSPSQDSEYDDATEEVNNDTIDVPPAGDCLEVFQPVANTTDTSEASSKTEDESHEGIGESKAEDQSGKSSKSDLNSQVSISSSRVSSARVSTSSDNISLGMNLDEFEEIEEEEGVDVNLISALDQEVYKTSIDMRMLSSKMCRLSGLIQQFCGVSHCLVHAVLSGRPVLIAAAEPYRALVTVYTKALATLLPHAPGSLIPVLEWHAGTVTNFHIERYSIIGVCIPERLHVQDLMSNATLNQVTVLNIETGHISGVAYSGTLVRGVERYSRRCFKSDAALFAALQANLVTMGLKVFLLYHLLQTTSRHPSEVLKAIGVSRGDWNVIKHLTALVLKQMNAPQATVSLCES